ncbi:DUF6843 domain-containing protein [Cyclobacterium amurskyense]|uniref:DUF6843 domain-containing protein n=1 Tax=Cyclobacterium amurskyense TaxID=320787 RepID=A0A0H4PF78_9BACT|nr:hypothetical protein [Cyclobacterium amurskyense]AKP52899.1 hypothetical protein CA2015_3517 [Cyclobacterium amurskyense]
MTKSNSNTLFGISIAFFVLGLFCFLTFWLMYLGFGLMILGTILCLLSKKKWFYQVLLIGLPFGFVAFTFLNAMEIPERYLLPEDFRGVVYVVFDQENGKEKEYEGIHRVYRIPESGILFTQFSQNEEVYSFQEFFFVNSNGKRKELGELDYRHFNTPNTINPRATEPPRDSLVVFNQRTIGRILAKDEQNYYNYKALTIGKYNEIEKWDYLDPEKIGKAKKEQLKE